MNFQYLTPVIRGKTLLDLAFGKAREKGVEKKLSGEWIDIIRKKKGLKLDVVKDMLVPKLRKTLDNFPKTKELPEFYIKLMNLTLDIALYQKSLGSLDWAADKVSFFHREYSRKMGRAQEREKMKEYSNQFYGRVSSVIKQVEKNLSYLEEARKIMRTYPDIKEMFTVCVYGFPNVGKTTLLNRLTGTEAETAAYAFTTKTINAGYFMINEDKVQVLDVPGSLARPEKMNNIERQADLVMRELATIIIFVFDLSGYSGYSIKKQDLLYRQLGKEKKVLVYLSKVDLTAQEVLDEFKDRHYSVDELKQEIGKDAEKKREEMPKIPVEETAEETLPDLEEEMLD